MVVQSPATAGLLQHFKGFWECTLLPQRSPKGWTSSGTLRVLDGWTLSQLDLHSHLLFSESECTCGGESVERM